jgi:hypothetical protein
LPDRQRHPFHPLLRGSIEPHRHLLRVPPDNVPLYKMMTVENLICSIHGNYLHFKRVDSYRDFPNADLHDGQELPQDAAGNAELRFASAPGLSLSDYYDRCRGRTYASCFSLENSQFIWESYANGGTRGKVCVVFNFDKLRSRINQEVESETARLQYHGISCYQPFSVNYGLVEYVEWAHHHRDSPYVENPVQYTFLKDKRYRNENEFRVAMSTTVMGQFALDDGRLIEFPEALQLNFDLNAAIANGTVVGMICSEDCDREFFTTELRNARILLDPA